MALSKSPLHWWHSDNRGPNTDVWDEGPGNYIRWCLKHRKLFISVITLIRKNWKNMDSVVILKIEWMLSLMEDREITWGLLFQSRGISGLIPAEFSISERYLIFFSIRQGQKQLLSLAVPQTSSGATWGLIAYSALYSSFERNKCHVLCGFWKMGTMGTVLRTDSAFSPVSRQTLPVVSALPDSIRTGSMYPGKCMCCKDLAEHLRCPEFNQPFSRWRAALPSFLWIT